MCRSRETCLSAKCVFLCACTHKIQLSVLVQYKADTIILLSKCNPFSPCMDQLKHCSRGTTQRSLTKDLYEPLNERQFELPTVAFYLLIEMVFVFIIFYCAHFLVYYWPVMKCKVFVFLFIVQIIILPLVYKANMQLQSGFERSKAFEPSDFEPAKFNCIYKSYITGIRCINTCNDI